MIDDNTFYYKISQKEFDKIITKPDLYSFPEKYIEYLRNIVGNVEVSNAEAYSSMGSECVPPYKNSWLINDNWGLDKIINSDYIVVHRDKDTKYFVDDFGEDDTVIIERFTVRIKVSNVNIDIIMSIDEWFLIFWEIGDKYLLYKCDQFTGVIKLIEDFEKIKDKS